VLFVAVLLMSVSGARADIRHRMEVHLDPDSERLQVRDTLQLPQGHQGALRVLLHRGLALRVVDPGASLRELAAPDRDQADVPLQAFLLEPETGASQVTLEYEGVIHHPVTRRGGEYARSFGVSPGLISPQGVFLAGSSYWYPRLSDPQPLRFEVRVRLAPGWLSVSQGERSAQTLEEGATWETWSSEQPQEEIYLVAAPYHEYSQLAGAGRAMVFLRQPDPALARRYLEATGQYLALYEELIGPYPYPKFALVENFWETGYGMPSFTLLGPRVIRLPFILHSSYPHEILHNWWGNGVYVDYGSGNWSEGLTSYLADHLIQEQRGQGAEYRRSSLQKYADHVRGQRDFPLSEFRARHSSATQAVGYGKSLMLFHMLRMELGDVVFVDGLRRFYREQLFRQASFADLERSFSAAAGRSLGEFFGQWVRRTGAPELRLSQARAEPTQGGFRLRALLEQVQEGPLYRMQVPLAVHLQGQSRVHPLRVVLTERRHQIDLQLPARPLRLDLDPELDLFRRLDRNEIPPALTQAFGAERALALLPSAAAPQLLAAYRQLAESWQSTGEGQLEIRLDRELGTLPPDRAIWLFGWDNRFRPQLAEALQQYPFADLGERLRIGDQELVRRSDSAVVLARLPANPEQALAWVASDNPAALPGLGRKLPHYGKYSYLGFAGDEPANRLKGQWPVVGSPLSQLVSQADGVEVAEPVPAELPPRQPLAPSPTEFSVQRMAWDVGWLAGPAMEGRGLGTAGLERAADYIAEQFQAAGLEPAGDRPGDWFQVWAERTGPQDQEQELRNVVGVVPGNRSDWTGQSLVIGAHYDHLGYGWPDRHRADRGKIHPGADDNASGVALLLELARYFARIRPERSLVFVAFSGEEAGRLGSRHYLDRAGGYPANGIRAMLNLDTLGRLESRELLVLGTGSAREWPHIFRGAGYVTGLGLKSVADDYGASDQRSFLDAGVPAVQLFSGPHGDYHRASDTAAKLDLQGMLKIAGLLKEVVTYLAARPHPLSSSLEGAAPPTPAPTPARREVSLGTVPDFAYPGPGVRLSGVTAGTPAEQVGLRGGDVILAVDARPLADLRAFAVALRGLRPEQRVRVRFRRGDQEREVVTRVMAR